MRGLAYFHQGDIHFTDNLSEPKIQSGDELILEVSWCGICGTDLHEYTDGPIFMPKDGCANELSGNGLPLAMGHEMSGIVSEVGSKVTRFKKGDHVVVDAGCGCLDTHRFEDTQLSGTMCNACKIGMVNCCSHAGFIGLGVGGGGFAEKVLVAEQHCIKVPKEIPLDVAALVEPLSVSWHAVSSSGFQRGQTACVFGAGPIGLATILVLKGFGASKIVVSELAKIRRVLAESLNVETFDPSKHGKDAIEELRKIPEGDDGFDFAFDCSGVKPTFDGALKVTTFRGTSVNLAIWGNKPIDYYPMDVTLKEKKLTGSIGYVVKDFEGVVSAIHDGRIPLSDCRHLITGKQKLEDGWEKGFLELMNHKDSNVKILLTPNNHGELHST
ncbi:hypothetical protein HG535_0E02110 [Zygotorulaspora mrakii]|uniref:Enoyl reductase (ER) domain-containing protein n=1 Tax=Zygotorulaspora mrakii TaxID=42260 RepID=A0A7H9B3Q9_ZYGMR|nr:uncharacterized protein HG535_0E02110 [Zygotorulaspora mrakii]QLG73127.1 hypothetical protein HG535_0E02110 [Zygotorulaspora mrakii]